MSVPFFFILGRPRSGTTLLKTLFDAHPGVRIPPELPILVPLYRKFRKVKYWDAEQKQAFIDYVFRPVAFNRKRIENFGIDREVFTAAVMGNDSVGSLHDMIALLNASASSFFPKSAVRLVGDKNPGYSAFASELPRMFPEAIFICIIRDYRDNYISLRNLAGQRMEAPVLSLQVARWAIVARQFLACVKKYPDRVRLVRYEDLVAHPREQFAELCRFTGIPYNEEVFEFYRKKDEFMAANPDPMVRAIHGSLMNPVNKGRTGLWKTEMTEEEVRIADQLAGRTATLLGYERSARFSPGIWIRTLPMVMYGRLLFAVMRWGTRMPSALSNLLVIALPKLVRIYHAMRRTGRDRS